MRLQSSAEFEPIVAQSIAATLFHHLADFSASHPSVFPHANTNSAQHGFRAPQARRPLVHSPAHAAPEAWPRQPLTPPELRYTPQRRRHARPTTKPAPTPDSPVCLSIQAPPYASAITSPSPD